MWSVPVGLGAKRPRLTERAWHERRGLNGIRRRGSEREPAAQAANPSSSAPGRRVIGPPAHHRAAVRSVSSASSRVLIRVEGIVESMGLLGNGVNIDIGGIGTSPEDFRPGGDGGCELEAVVGVEPVRFDVIELDVRIDLDPLERFGILPAQADLAEVIAATDRPVEVELVQGGHGVTRREFAGIDLVVAEVSVENATVLETDQPVLLHEFGIELDLDASVDRNGGERVDEFLLEQPLGLTPGIDVGIEAVALIGQLLHGLVVVVAHAEADGHELDPVDGAIRNASGELIRVDGADVGNPVTGENETIDAAFDKGSLGQRVGGFESGLQVRAATGSEIVDCGKNLTLIGRCGRPEQDRRVIACR